MRFSKFLARNEDNSEKEDFVEYHVRPISVTGDSVDCVGLTFHTRDMARQYKRFLKGSNVRLDSKIIRRESIGGYIMSEQEIS